MSKGAVQGADTAGNNISPWSKFAHQENGTQRNTNPIDCWVTNNATISIHSTGKPTSSAMKFADWFLARQREAANPVLVHDTGELLEYCTLLHHPKFKVALNILAATEFGWLAQDNGCRVKGMDTLYFIHKSEVPIIKRCDLHQVCLPSPNRKEGA